MTRHSWAALMLLGFCLTGFIWFGVTRDRQGVEMMFAAFLVACLHLMSHLSRDDDDHRRPW